MGCTWAVFLRNSKISIKVLSMPTPCATHEAIMGDVLCAKLLLICSMRVSSVPLKKAKARSEEFLNMIGSEREGRIAQGIIYGKLE